MDCLLWKKKQVVRIKLISSWLIHIYMSNISLNEYICIYAKLVLKIKKVGKNVSYKWVVCYVVGANTWFLYTSVKRAHADRIVSLILCWLSKSPYAHVFFSKDISVAQSLSNAIKYLEDSEWQNTTIGVQLNYGSQL